MRRTEQSDAQRRRENAQDILLPGSAVVIRNDAQRPYKRNCDVIEPIRWQQLRRSHGVVVGYGSNIRHVEFEDGSRYWLPLNTLGLALPKDSTITG